MKFPLLTVLSICTASAASGAVVIDGTRDASYGSPLAVQQVFTGFGDNTDAGSNFATGSELDAAYAEISEGRLNLFLAGNLETNFNKLNIFIDSGAGGMNRLTPLATDQGNFNRMADNGSGNGLTFDAGFTASHWISINAGGSSPDVFVDYANLVTGTGSYAGRTTPGNSTLTEGNSSVSISATLNNSNTAGVTGTTAPNDAASVATGIELSISLVDLGYTGGPLRVSAFINGQSQDFLSNQVLGSLPGGTANLGEPRNVNFNNLVGDQFFTVIPEPSSLSLLAAVAGAAALRRRRRK